MDVATRYQPRMRDQPSLRRERIGMPNEGDCEPSTPRKVQRTTNVTTKKHPDPLSMISSTSSSATHTFRKPTLPASATRLEPRPNHPQRRRSTQRDRENGARIPSGPRELPGSGGGVGLGSPGKSRTASTSSTAYLVDPSTLDGVSMMNSAFLPQTTSEDHMGRAKADQGQEQQQGFELVPTRSFDDFQDSIPRTNDFPVAAAMSRGPVLFKEEPADRSMMSNGFTGVRAGGWRPQQEDADMEASSLTSRSASLSLRQRLARQASGQSAAATLPSSVSQPQLSVITGRRQSTMPPRKSVGGALLTANPDLNAISTTTSPSKPSVPRTSSLKTARRTTLHTAASTGPELPRISTFTATTQSRQSKINGLQPVSRRPDPNTPANARPTSKGGNAAHGSQTPTSSGNAKRQSTISGRASGLGARTISPTDARRLKRMSMMHAPPMPTQLPSSKGTATPTPQHDPNPHPSSSASLFFAGRPELPRLTQPSPSLIPRKTSSATSSTATASPEGRLGMGSVPPAGGVSLSRKSSYQSLLSNSNSTSRLPTPKPRNDYSSSAQYGERREEDDDEFVPPVPAIPQAYESPKDYDLPPFFHPSSLKSSQSVFNVSQPAEPTTLGEFDFEHPLLPPGPRTKHYSPDQPAHQHEHHHKRTATVGNHTHHTNVPAWKTAKAPPDLTGRKNNSLQPLRLPPLNLAPITTARPFAHLLHPSSQREEEIGGRKVNANPDDVDDDEFGLSSSSVRTPEPRRSAAKTPSTPMTASKATSTFFSRRRDEEGDRFGVGKAPGLRASASQYALRDLRAQQAEMMMLGSGVGHEGGSMEGLQMEGLQMEDFGARTRWLEDSGEEEEVDEERHGVMIGGGEGIGMELGRQRAAITPFASGSLPKVEGDWSRDEYDLGGGDLRIAAPKQLQYQHQRQYDEDRMQGVLQSPQQLPEPATQLRKREKERDKEKEGTGGGLRRKLSRSWRRASSKNANHADNKDSPPHQQQSQQYLQDGSASEREKERAHKLPKRSNELSGYPRLATPSSALTAGLESTSIPSLPRPSLERIVHARRKSTLSGLNITSSIPADAASHQQQPPSSAKTRSLHSENPQPVLAPTNAVSLSGNGNGNGGGNGRTGSWDSRSMLPPPRQKLPPLPTTTTTTAPISVLVKDHHDVAADEEMRRLSQKRRDVDTAARESEALLARAVLRDAMSPERVLHDRGGGGLNLFERGEVVDYEAQGIYFTGGKGARKVVGSLVDPSASGTVGAGKEKDETPKGGNNFGYDDERGDYNIVLGDHLAYRYEVVDLLGKGSFGQVVRCVDHKEGGVVAVKIIRNKKRFHQQALVEVGILGRLREWDPDGAHATLCITSSFYFRSHLCIVTPCLSINLYELIRAHNFSGFPLLLIRRFARQLLACLALLAQHHIIHCDLKPENILLCEARKADVRVIDFGSSCREEEKVYTYIQSRFYRSPEVILGSTYGLGIDVWSLGCILAELWTGYPLFPGENEQEQLACIMEIFGPPDRHLVERCSRKKLFFDSVGKPRVTVSSKGKRRRVSSRTLAQALKSDDEAFLDFVGRCLRWDPERRIKPAEALVHPFVTGAPWRGGLGLAAEGDRIRAARVRSSVAVPTAAALLSLTMMKERSLPVNGTASPAAKKREGNAFAAQQQQQPHANTTTPGKEVASLRAAALLPDTPQTALRQPASTSVSGNHNNGSSANASGSPRKLDLASRRHSTAPALALASAAANGASGSKRASNGAVLIGASSAASGGLAAGSGPGSGAAGGGSGVGVAGQRLGGAGGGLAQMAARESMGASMSGGAGTRWRG